MVGSSVRVALVGAGAVGGSVAADLIEAGIDLTVIDQWPAHVEAMRADGLTVNTLGAERTVPIAARHVCEVAELRQPFDIVLTGVKTYDTRWVAELMRPMMRDDSVFVGLQNGMTIDQSAELLGADRTIGCAMGIAANLPRPGYINRQVTPAGTWFAIGALSGVRTTRVDELGEILGHAAVVEVTDDIRSAKWMKLIANIPEMLPSSILGVPLVEAARMPGVRPVMDAMSREAYALASDLGIAMRPSLGIREEDMPATDQYALDLLDRVLSHFSQPDTRVAVLQDWQKGRRGELDAFSGYIVRTRATHGGRAPVNEAVLRLAESVERGDLTPSPENAAMLMATVQTA